MATATSNAPYQFRLEMEIPSIAPQNLVFTLSDFHPAVDAATFEALRRGKVAAYDPPYTSFEVRPEFARNASRRVKGFRITIPSLDGEFSAEFGLGYFRPKAEQLIGELASRYGDALDRLPTVIKFEMYAEQVPLPDPSPRPFLLAPESPRIPITVGDSSTFINGDHWDKSHSNDHSIFMPKRVIDDAIEEAKRDPDREVGGLLLGHLKRDTRGSDLYVEVTCHVPAAATESTETSITFTPQTWAHARDVASHRGRDEMIVGWVHSHPFSLCEDCPVQAPKECIDKVLFYSRDDRFVMRQLFHQPYMIGLLTAIEPKIEAAFGHPPVRMYGWRKCRLVKRGFTVHNA